MIRKLFAFLLLAGGIAMLTACSSDKSENEASSDNTTEATTANAEEQPQAAEPAELSFEQFSSELKEFCGLEPIKFDEMSNIKVNHENSDHADYSLYASLAAGGDTDKMMGTYFNAIAKIADNGKIYGIDMQGDRGNDTFSNFDEYVKFIKANGVYAKARYSYDYQGKRVDVNCMADYIGDGTFGLSVKKK
ncbi:MAG: hypothetical protein IJ632_02895 [Muribaculaceae bacterium]|nr:hypothetical protein [Muribaculaceae bacterium]